MKKTVFSILAALSLVSVIGASQAQASWERIPSKSGSFCKDDINDFFEARFPGEKITSMDKFGSGRGWAIWARTTVCSGYLVFDFNGIEGYECTMPQYGSRTVWLRRVWGYGGCSSVMPHDEYPY